MLGLGLGLRLLSFAVSNSADMRANDILPDTTALKAVPTIGINNKAYFVEESGQLQIWSLQTGNAAEDITNGIARPTDYATTTNEKNFKREL